MVYEWEQHKDVCYALYIQERKSLEDIMQHMKDVYKFTPSKRAFQTQFRRWGFPSKQNPAHRNVDLVSRIKELWEQNYTQRHMLETLNDEGFEIKERELMRVRAKNRWLLRIPNGSKPTAEEELFQAQLLEATGLDPQEDLPDDIQRKRKERHEQLQTESDELWATKKRRRRTRDYAGLAADPPGPPRFPSETTLAESMEFLGVDKNQYRELRERFQQICEEDGIIKKTIAGNEKWQAAKSRLIQDLSYLTIVFANGLNVPAKELALDVICTDVTKRMRTVERRMTIVDSKNILGINPEQSRQIRNSFYTILQTNHFTSKLETGHDHWAELKEQWIAKSPLLQEILRPGDSDPQHESKKKALEVLCRDVMKRLRDDHKRRGSGKPMIENSPSASDLNEISAPITEPYSDTIAAAISSASDQVPPPLPVTNFDGSDFQIDPSLLQATGFTMPEIETPIPFYARPHPKSQIHMNDKMWLGTLTTRSVAELHAVIGQKWSDALLTRIDGVKKGADGREISYLIEEDVELDAYLDHVADLKVIFVILMVPR